MSDHTDFPQPASDSPAGSPPSPPVAWHLSATDDIPPPPPPPPPPGSWQLAPPPGRTGHRGLAGALAAIFVVGIGSGVAAARLTAGDGGAVANATTNQTQPALGDSSGDGSATTGGSADGSAIAAKVTPGIVNINVTFSGNGGAAGTGMVITSTGEVLTNNHVIDGETSISVELPSTGKTYSAHVLGYDLTEDIALVQIDGGGSFRTVSVGNSSTVSIGDAVVALGNALGRNGAPSVTSGNVTRLNQTITASDQSGGDVETVSGLIQVNAQIQPGDSGGPLVNSSGSVIGMNTAAEAGSSRFSQQASTVAYAIPINKAISVVKQIQSGQPTAAVHVGATRALLGVGAQDTANGVQVQTVQGGSPAANAGIGVGSLITALNGTPIATNAALRAAIVAHDPGQSVSVTWTDSAGQSHTASVTLTTGPPA